MMDMAVEYAQGTVPVTILTLQGELDASNFETLLSTAKMLYHAGTRRLLLDMNQLSFMSSAGIVALHNIILLMRGAGLSDPNSGWEAFHNIKRDLDSGKQPNVKILDPQPKVMLTLQKSGMDRFCDIYTDLQSALNSFA
ncbi:MAG: STAS domain-containing protein [Acidobacteriaceae bacterium]